MLRHQAASSSIEDTLRQELNSQREVASRLRQDLAAARQALHDTAAQWEERYNALQEQLEQQQQAAEQLQRELHARPTVVHLQELQQQVRALQAIGYGSVEELQPFSPQAGAAYTAAAAAGSEAAGSGTNALAAGAAGAAAAGSGGLMNLEGLLLAKSRKLEHELTMAKLAMAEASQELAAAREQVGEQRLHCWPTDIFVCTSGINRRPCTVRSTGSCLRNVQRQRLKDGHNS
jgi:homeobox protein cut-like